MSGEYTFRDEMRDKSPYWLANGRNQKLLYSLTVILDCLGDALVQGIKSRYPGLVDMSTLGFIGQERRIRRGITESDETYALRLQHWLDYHRVRGSPYPLLEQIGIRYDHAFPVDLVYRNGRRYRLDTAGNITRDVVPWSPSGPPELWGQWWLLCFTDSITTAQDRSELAALAREWNAAHCHGRIALLTSTSTIIAYHPPHLIDEPDTIDTPDPVTYIEV